MVKFIYLTPIVGFFRVLYGSSSEKPSHLNDDRYGYSLREHLDFSNTDKEAPRVEMILPIEIDSRRKARGQTLRNGEIFFDAIDVYIRKLNNVHGADFQYEAHHVGRATEYCPLNTCKAPDATQKGWNLIIAGSNRVHLTWEGDMHSCKSIKTAKASASNVICSFERANEYCHRHGGELFFPDEYYWYFFFKPMCSDKANRYVHANVLGASYSQTNYWVNMQRVEDGANSELYNVKTRNEFHFLRPGFNSENVYSGFDASNNVVEEENIYQYLLMRDQDNHDENNPEYFSISEISNSTLHSKVGKIRYDTTSRKNMFNEYFAIPENKRSLNMKYISDHLSNGGLVSQGCVMMQCDDSNESPKLQDYACDHNNVRPMCIIKDLLMMKDVCPNDLLKEYNPEEKTQCGDMVVKNLVTTVMGKLSDQDIYGRFKPSALTQDDGSILSIEELVDSDSATLTPAVLEKRIGSNFYGKDNVHNFFISAYKVFQDRLTLVKSNNPDLEVQNKARMYYNCYGEHQGNDLIEGKKYFHQTSAEIRRICRMYGYNYKAFDLDGDAKGEKEVKGVIFEEDIDFCECTCPAELTFDDANKDDALSVSTQRSNTFCCAAGYEFVPEKGFEDQYNLSNCNRCTQVFCQDEFGLYSPQQQTPFWRNEAGNWRRVWKNSSAGDMLSDQDRIRGSCVPLPCAPPEDSDKPGSAWTSFIKDSDSAFGPVETHYADNEVVEYQCGKDYCGRIEKRCRVNVSNIPGTCTDHDWVFNKDNCVKATCSTDDVENSTNDGLSKEVGNSFTFTCKPGYEIWRDGTRLGTKFATTDVCNMNTKLFDYADNRVGSCSTTISHDIECRPMKCNRPAMADPSDTIASDWASGPVRYAVGLTIEWECENTHCGEYKSECVYNADTDSVDWQAPVGACVSKKCEKPTVANGKIQNAVSTLEDGEVWNVQCDEGFVTQASLNAGSPSRASTITCNIDTAKDCSQLHPHPIQCVPVTCDKNPCGASYSASDITGHNIGDSAQCSCSAEKVQGRPVCKSVCTLSGDFLSASWVTPDCLCREPECAWPKNVPNGVVTPSVPASLDDSVPSSIPIDQHVDIVCNAGFTLSWSHDDSAVDNAQKCRRFCYKPPMNTCRGDANADSKYIWDSKPFAVLDPLRCYCKPKRCPKLTDSDMGIGGSYPGYSMLNKEKGEGDHYPVAGFDTVALKCTYGFREAFGNGKGNRDSVKCTDNAGTLEWSNPDNCVQIGCPNPRNSKNTIFTRSLNLDSTCESLDRIRLSEDDEFVGFDSEGINFAESSRLFWNDHGKDAAKYKLGAANVKNGAVAQFTCKKGFKAFNNAVQALESGRWGPSPSNSFECSCVDGIWQCNKFCRCEGFCKNPDEKEEKQLRKRGL